MFPDLRNKLQNSGSSLYKCSISYSTLKRSFASRSPTTTSDPNMKNCSWKPVSSVEYWKAEIMLNYLQWPVEISGEAWELFGAHTRLESTPSTHPHPHGLSSKLSIISARASSQFETLLGRYLTPSEAIKICSSTWIWGSGQKSSGSHSRGPIRNGDSRHESATLTSPGCKYTNSCAFCSGKCFLFWEGLSHPLQGPHTQKFDFATFLLHNSLYLPTFLGTSLTATSQYHFDKTTPFLLLNWHLVWIFKC
jgi:hypothetical protein